MQELIKILNRKFEDVSIVTLKDFTKKIAVISKIRIGKNSNFTNYDEVSLSNVDQDGVLLPFKKGEELGSANPSIIKSQSLNNGDILISYRGKKYFNVGIVYGEYERTIIGSNSAIRIQFKDDINYQIPLIIQAYLEESYIQNYLTTKTKDAKGNRHLLSSKTLMSLPVPQFDNYLFHDFGRFNARRRSVKTQANLLLEKSNDILSKISQSQESDLELFTKNDISAIDARTKYENLSLFLSKINEQLTEVDKIFDKKY